MQEERDRLKVLEEQVAALQQRVTDLEASLPPPLRGATFSERRKKIMGPPGLEVSHDTLQDIQGTIRYEGIARFAHAQHRHHRREPLAKLFQDAPEPLAQVFAAFSSPHRIIILRTLCQGPHSRQQLQELLGMASAGQLYHHLKELQSAGLITQRERSAYIIEPGAVIPVCVALMAISQLAFSERREGEEQEQTELEE